MKSVPGVVIFFNLKQHYVILTQTHCFEKQNLTMHIHTSRKTNWVKPGHILWQGCPTTALPQFCDSRRFLKATCRLPAEQSCNRSTGSLLCLTALLKQKAADRQSSRRTSEGKPAGIFSVKHDPILLKLLFCTMYYRALSSFIFQSSG